MEFFVKKCAQINVTAIVIEHSQSPETVMFLLFYLFAYVGDILSILIKEL